MTTVLLDSPLLQRLAARYAFPYDENEMIIFGIRGGLPVKNQSLGFSENCTIASSAIDHVNFACTIGQWLPSANRIAAFVGSTVPAGASIEKALRGQMRANQVLPGRYEYVIGQHGLGRSGEHRALRQASFAPVQRSQDNGIFDHRDGIDFGSGADDFVWNNIHCAYTLGPSNFSSAGCQVIQGLPKSPGRNHAPEEGHWKRFVEPVYGDFKGQRAFTYMLFPMEAVALAHATPDAQLQNWLCYGSSGAEAKHLQQALIAKGYLAAGEDDGDFGRITLMALAKFQRDRLGAKEADGVCGPKTAAALGLAMPVVSTGAIAPATAARVTAPADPATSASDEPNLPQGDIQSLGDAFRRRLRGILGLPTPRGRKRQRRVLPPPASPRQGLDEQPFMASLSRSGLRFSDPLQRSGMMEVAQAWARLYPSGDPRHLAYILASVYHETGGRMVPVREGFALSDAAARAHVTALFRKGKIKADYGLPVRGISYYARGRVQTTHFDNYRRLGLRFRRDFIGNPDQLLDPALDAEIACIGHVEGLWTGRKLADFITGPHCDYKGARRIVNGTDRAEMIAGYARNFEAALAAAATAGATIPPEIAVHPETEITMIQERESFDPTGRLIELEDRLAEIREALVGRAAAKVKDVLDGPDDKLSPIDGILGQTVGRLLSGKKTTTGLVGTVLTAIVGSSEPGGWLGNLTNAVGQAVPFLAGGSAKVMPVMLALLAWGLSAKLEKAILHGPVPR